MEILIGRIYHLIVDYLHIFRYTKAARLPFAAEKPFTTGFLPAPKDRRTLFSHIQSTDFMDSTMLIFRSRKTITRLTRAEKTRVRTAAAP